MDLLLSAGADPNIVKDRTFYPLIIASCMTNDSGEMVQKLLNHGANVNNVDSKGYGALHLSAWNGHDIIVQCLLSYGAEHDCPTADKNTPLGLACHGNHITFCFHITAVGIYQK